MAHKGHHAGFGLLETVVATGLLVVVAAGVAQLTALSMDATRRSGRDTIARLLAIQKMEQLTSLPWRYDHTGRRVSDVTTDLTRDPPGSRGVGLTASARDSLDRNRPGYVDYLDRGGRWIGTGTVYPSGTAFVRRWSIQRHRSAPDDLLVLEVVVLPVPVAAHRWTTSGSPPPGVVWLSTMRAR